MSKHKEGQKIVIVEFYTKGELSQVLPFWTRAEAVAEVARFLREAIRDVHEFVTGIELHDNRAKLLQLTYELQRLFAREQYESFIARWDTWVTEGDFDGPTPRNFNLTEHTLA